MATKTQNYDASVLAFERQLDPSDGLMAAGKWDDCEQAASWPTLSVREKAVRGTLSHRLKVKNGEDVAGLDADITNPNPQTVDVVTLPAEADTLKVSFTLKVLGGVGTPSACNNALHQARVGEIVNDYIAADGFNTLAERYAYNIACGRWLWRNRMKAESLRVTVTLLEQGKEKDTWHFDGLSLPLNTFTPSGEAKPALDALASHIAAGLAGQGNRFLRIEAFARVGEGQEIYPSQEMILNKSKGDKSKVLYAVGESAAIHSQKLGNALRTVDTWYPQAMNGDSVGPISAEPYGAVTSRGVAYRRPTGKPKQDFYSLYDNWIVSGQAPAAEQQHFVMSILLRGGVFGEAKKKD